MSSYTIALNFEDGVTRFIECAPFETVLDAAYKAQINLPMDCSDGVCGTCKCRAESGEYELEDDYIEDALTEAEAESGLVLTCQMMPQSDCVISVPVASTMCKIASEDFAGKVLDIKCHNDAVYELTLDVNGTPPAFLPGQYVNISLPESDQHRSYSFSSAPGKSEINFLIKQIPSGLMSSWLSRMQAGEEVSFTGPLGSFYLREPVRPLLFLAGGTGLAPFLSMLEVLAQEPRDIPIQLIYGVTRDQDLVGLEQLDQYVEKIPNFSYIASVLDADSNHPHKGYVMDHMTDEMFHGGNVDVYLCGPVPMVEAVDGFMKERSLEAASFYYERFIPSQ
ncbi:MAG TPA: benzoate 1,2-dioxygenase electron transfer component BenC [Paenalcaligenes sp.]|nr:benzoate 1,2-dioxygenase electron transfer component BenC [Paenalcaligenes sp.]